jgi:hypothetical protein
MTPKMAASIGNDIGLILENKNRYTIQSMIMGQLCHGMNLQQMSRKALLTHESILVAGPMDTHLVAI